MFLRMPQLNLKGFLTQNLKSKKLASAPEVSKRFRVTLPKQFLKHSMGELYQPRLTSGQIVLIFGMVPKRPWKDFGLAT